MSKHIRAQHEIWSAKRGIGGKKHDGSTKFRALVLPPGKNHDGWKIDRYLDRWDLIADKLRDAEQLAN